MCSRGNSCVFLFPFELTSSQPTSSFKGRCEASTRLEVSGLVISCVETGVFSGFACRGRSSALKHATPISWQAQHVGAWRKSHGRRRKLEAQYFGSLGMSLEVVLGGCL